VAGLLFGDVHRKPKRVRCGSFEKTIPHTLLGLETKDGSAREGACRSAGGKCQKTDYRIDSTPTYPHDIGLTLGP
jgi:hypothetical protein